MITTSLLSWDSYYSEPAPSIRNIISRQQTQLSLSSDYYICDSFISFCYSNNEGGAIKITSYYYIHFLIEKTTIMSCVSNIKAGGIYFYDEGNCVLAFVCGFNCSATTGECQFYNSRVSADTANKNNIFHSTITRSINTDQSKVIGLGRGKIEIQEVNISNNVCKTYSAARLVPYYDANPYSCCASFMQIANNTSIESDCLHFSYFNNKEQTYCILKSCNIIENKQNIKKSSYGIINSAVPIDIYYSNILKNQGKFILTRIKYECYFALHHCFLDSKSATNGTITMDNMLNNKYPIAMHNLHTAACKGKITNFKPVYELYQNNLIRKGKWLFKL